MNRRDRVIVVGAGMAGLASARLLAEAGKQVTVLEARSRIGGRIHTRRMGAEVLESGAEFVHGRPPELWRLIEEAGLKVDEVSGKRLCYDGHDLTECDEQWDDSFQLIEDLKGWQGADCSFAEYLEHANVRGNLRERAASYVEGFNAADRYRIGVASLGKQQAAEDAIEGDRLFRIRDGYAEAPSFLDRKLRLAGGSVVFDARVEAVVWRPGHVDVGYRVRDRREQAAADCAVITLPLGILQAHCVEFSPEPVEVLRAAEQAVMGQARRITLLFREKFWLTLRGGRSTATLNNLSFLHAPGEVPPVWWTRFPAEDNSLVGWAGGPLVKRLDGLNEDELAKAACGTLAPMFGLRKEEVLELLVECDSYDWRRDPFSRGVYSYLPAGALDAPRRMSEPAGGTLYFAGEHTDTTGHWGTVHAALRSGLRAAAQVLGR